MSDSEKKLGIIRDVLLPTDTRTRYDLYFTNGRVAIVCMGRANRFEPEAGPISIVPSAFGVPPPISSNSEKAQNARTIDEETKDLSLDDILRLSKKSCFYTIEEIEEVKLVLGRKPKFIILSKDCESKFSPTEEQLAQLSEILPKIEMLRNKLSLAGSWDTLHELFKGQFCEK